MRYVFALLLLLAFPSTGNAQFVTTKGVFCNTPVQIETVAQYVKGEKLSLSDSLHAVNALEKNACGVLLVVLTEVGRVKQLDLGGKDYDIMEVEIHAIAGMPQTEPFHQYGFTVSKQQGVKM